MESRGQGVDNLRGHGPTHHSDVMNLGKCTPAGPFHSQRLGQPEDPVRRPLFLPCRGPRAGALSPWLSGSWQQPQGGPGTLGLCLRSQWPGPASLQLMQLPSISSVPGGPPGLGEPSCRPCGCCRDTPGPGPHLPPVRCCGVQGAFREHSVCWKDPQPRGPVWPSLLPGSPFPDDGQQFTAGRQPRPAQGQFTPGGNPPPVLPGPGCLRRS